MCYVAHHHQLQSSSFLTLQVTAPVATTTYNGGHSALVSWQDDGKPPSLPTFGLASVAVYTGNAQQQVKIQQHFFSKTKKSDTSLDKSANHQF
jgi:hypothetical protein